MTTISFFAIGIPKAQPRAQAQIRRFGTKMFAHVYTPGTAENWKSCIADSAKAHIPTPPMACPIHLELMFYLPRPVSHFGTGKNAGNVRESAPKFHTVKPDLDNAIKAVMDTLTTLRFWLDDCQVCKTWCEKQYESPGLPAGCQITIIPLENKTDVSTARTVLISAPQVEMSL